MTTTNSRQNIFLAIGMCGLALLLFGWILPAGIHTEPQTAIVYDYSQNPVEQFNLRYSRLQVINMYLSDPDTDPATVKTLKQERSSLTQTLHLIVQQTPIENYTDNMRPYIKTTQQETE